MDQHFCFSKGPTYADRGDKTVWVRGGASGLEKRQCTVQLTIFADGEPRIKPLDISWKGTTHSFTGKGFRSIFMCLAVTSYMQLRYDSRVRVQFHVLMRKS